MIKTIDDMKMCYVPRYDKEVFELFMDKCEEFGLSWSAYSGGEPRDIKSGEVVVFNGSINKLLTHASEDYVVAKEYKRLTLSDLKPHTRTEYEKVTESIFDLRDDFERGELYTKKFSQEWHQIKTEEQLGNLLSMNDDPTKNGIYRMVEMEIDWRDEVESKFSFIECNKNHKSVYIKTNPSIEEDSFLEMCRVALRANGEIE